MSVAGQGDAVVACLVVVDCFRSTNSIEIGFDKKSVDGDQAIAFYVFIGILLGDDFWKGTWTVSSCLECMPMGLRRRWPRDTTWEPQQITLVRVAGTDVLSMFAIRCCFVPSIVTLVLGVPYSRYPPDCKTCPRRCP